MLMEGASMRKKFDKWDLLLLGLVILSGIGMYFTIESTTIFMKFLYQIISSFFLALLVGSATRIIIKKAYGSECG